MILKVAEVAEVATGNSDSSRSVLDEYSRIEYSQRAFDYGQSPASMATRAAHCTNEPRSRESPIISFSRAAWIGDWDALKKNSVCTDNTMRLYTSV